MYRFDLSAKSADILCVDITRVGTAWSIGNFVKRGRTTDPARRQSQACEDPWFDNSYSATHCRLRGDRI